MFNSSYDYVDAVVDEIALEGLDGITLEGLWVRLSKRPNFCLALDDASKSFIWNFVRRLEGVTMYKLPTPRKPLVIFNRYDFMDNDLGMVLEPENVPDDPYPHCAVEDTENNVRGSCSTYYTRVDVTSEAANLNLREVERTWGLSLVVVASQSLRNLKLTSPSTNPQLEMTLMQYCLLERIGRSRLMGEVTQGKVSLQLLGEDPKALFYYRKFLLQHKLIVKQVHHLKTSGHNCSGSLLHLPRFYVERKPKILYLTEKVILYLKSKPHYLADYSQVREMLGFQNSSKNLLKNLLKTFDFQRYIKADVSVPYRQLYPDAKITEWKHKGSDRERQVRVLKLINPDMDVREMWSRYDDNMYEDEECDASPGLLDCKDLYIDQALITQAFNVVDRAGPKGISQIELGQIMGLAKLQARVICRNLLKRGVVSTYMNDVGRQRVSRYVSLRYEKESIMSVQFTREKDRMLNLLSNRPTLQELQKSSSTIGIKRAAVDDDDDSDAERSDRVKRRKPSKKPSVGRVLVRLGLMQDRHSASKKKQEVDTSTSRSVDGEGSVDPIEDAMYDDAPSTLAEEAGSSCEKAGRTVEDQSYGEVSKSVRRKESNSGFVEDLKNLELTQESAPVTYRLLKRANLIIETVRSHKVVYDLQKLMKLISDEEVKEGYNVKMDKKSLLRLLLKLAHDGNIKIFKVYLKSDTKEKVLSFVCDPTICANHTVIQSAIEQAKMKFFIPPTHRLNKVPTELPQLKMNETSKERSFNFETSTITESMKELKTFTMKSKDKMQQYQYNARMGKVYGLCPKFVRMKKFHQFLYYLVYAYEGDPKLDRQVALDQLAEKGTKLEDDIAQEAATIYYPDACWKMFVAPLPVHADWPKGWTIMCDILLRLPLSLFVEIYNITYVVPNIEEYLEHPIRRHYLLKYLPLEMRNVMMVARKYIFSIHEIAQHLCYAGLLQFGPQRLKEKDQVFVYLNRKATLLDTTFSRQGYHQVSDDIVYPVKKYEFTSMSDLDSYWYDLWNISIHTHLGGRMCMMGKDIVLEVLRHKQIMVDALKARTPDEASANDLGHVPGDKRGAAGLDSALFAHLKRNWSWTHQSMTGPYVYKSPSSIAFNKKITELKTARLASLKTDLLQSNIFQEMTKKEPVDPSMTTFTNLIKKRPSMGKKSENRPKPGNEVAPQEKKRRKARKKQIVRTVQPKRTPKRQRRPFYDDVDKRALRRMSKLRVEWSAAEDNLLLLCKVASVYICSNNHKQRVITFPMIRDVLHRKNIKYKNKTSRACQRRILYMMKSMSTACNVALHLEEMSQDPEIASQFKNTLAELRDEELSVEEFDAKLFEKFQALVDLLEQKSCRLGYACGTSETFIIPDTVEDFRNKYEVSYPRTSLKKYVNFREVKNIVDICCAVVNTVIHSSLCCMLDQCSDTYQLFQVYQQYPDNLLRSVITRLHSNQMVSLKKCYTRKLHRSGQYMPISSLPYQLSISYVNQLQTKYQYEVFHESYEMLKQLITWREKYDNEKGMEVDNTEGGRTAAFVELFNSGKVTFRVEVPDQIIVLDPRISDKDETFARIVQRYKDIVTSTKYRRLSNALKQHYGDAFANVNLTEAANTANSSEEPAQPSREGNEDSEYDSDVPDTFGEAVEEMSIVHHNAIARAASRIALYMLREDRKDKLMDELQHAHDFFVVNSCKVFCILGMNQLQSQLGTESLDKFYPISPQIKDNVIEEVKSTMVFDDKIPILDELHAKCISSGLNSEDWEKIEKLLEYAEKKKDMGVTVTELQEVFPKDDRTVPLSRILQFLSENRVLLRTGVCSVRYIHHRFTKPWLVRSYRTKSTHPTSQAPQSGMEVKVPEEMDVEPASLSSETEECASYGSLPMENKRCESPVLPKDIIIDEMELHNEPIVVKRKATNKSNKNKVIQKHSDQMKTEEVVEGSSKENEPLGSEHRESDNKQTLKPNKKSWKKCMNTLEQDCKDSKSVDPSNVEKIKVHVRPWVRIDGTLNRRVLDRMLGAVLGHAMHCPCDSLTKFWERFSPALQPFLVRELIEVLVKLECIKLKVLKISWKTTLFSKPSSITLVDADGTENDSDIIVEPEPDAVLRFGTFIGEKEYPSDFLCC